MTKQEKKFLIGNLVTQLLKTRDFHAVDFQGYVMMLNQQPN
jgi:hypothetical protein